MSRAKPFLRVLIHPSSSVSAVLVYQCARMADNCGECLALEPRFNCGWCESSGRCEVKDECAAPPWLDRSQPCPNPQVSITPARRQLCPGHCGP